ncbi:MAG: proline dehydrogenase family protein [Planctomycetota bacterium]
MLAQTLPDRFVLFFARPYVAGDSLAAALDTAAAMNEEGICSTLDLLAENVHTEERVTENVRVYEAMIDAVATDARFAAPDKRPTVSLKPSSFTTRPFGSSPGADARGSVETVTALAERARERGVGLTLDMEDRHWTDFTLPLAVQLFEAGHDVGTVLQTRLNRTMSDLERIPKEMRVRLVIGIYREPSGVATTSKVEMKKRLLHAAERLLRHGVYVELATHDAGVVRRFLKEVVPATRSSWDRFELQFLHGVPVNSLMGEVRSGALFTEEGRTPRMRLYVPFATSWDQATAYCRRRLAENPQIGTYVVRNIVRSFLGNSARNRSRARLAGR